MKEISQLHFRVCDHGLFLPVARRLAREARQVSYWTPVERAFPTIQERYGWGFDDIRRVDCYLDELDDVDCVVFPDVGFGGLQAELEMLGLPVWGARFGDELEVSRGLFLQELAKTGLPVPKHEKINGLSSLREYLRDKTDRWVKISRYRGDWETFHWRSAEEDAQFLDWKAVRLGPAAEKIVFYVFEPIPSEGEDGCDTWCIDGSYPSLVLHGMEAKDKAYVGAFQRYQDLPEEVRKVNDAFLPVLGEYGYRSFFSTEVRITEDGESYFIDPTCRAGSPPSQVLAEMCGNFAEVIWGGANGECVDPEPAAKFGVQAQLSFGHAHQRGRWQYLKVSDELDRWVKTGMCLREGDTIAFPPHADTDLTVNDLAWLTGIGDTFGEAIRHLKHNLKLLPDCVTCDIGPLAELLQQVEAAEAKGMEFTDQPVPKPESVVRP